MERFFGLIEAPILDGIADEVLGRVVISDKLDQVIKLLPIPEALKRLLGKQANDTKKDLKEWSKRVVKVSDVMVIAREEFNALNSVGTVAAIFLPQPTGPGALSPVDRLISRVKKKALQQLNPRISEFKRVDTRKP